MMGAGRSGAYHRIHEVAVDGHGLLRLPVVERKRQAHVDRVTGQELRGVDIWIAAVSAELSEGNHEKQC